MKLFLSFVFFSSPDARLGTQVSLQLALIHKQPVRLVSDGQRAVRSVGLHDGSGLRALQGEVLAQASATRALAQGCSWSCLKPVTRITSPQKEGARLFGRWMRLHNPSTMTSRMNQWMYLESVPKGKGDPVFEGLWRLQLRVWGLGRSLMMFRVFGVFGGGLPFRVKSRNQAPCSHDHLEEPCLKSAMQRRIWMPLAYLTPNSEHVGGSEMVCRPIPSEPPFGSRW